MIWLLIRDIFLPERTLGRLVDEHGRLVCYTCEDPDRGLDEVWTLAELATAKVAGETAIAIGLHALVLEDSPKYGRDTLTIKVPGHRVIRVHVGNTERDTLGCVLVGRTRSDDGVWDSRKALADLRERLLPVLKSGADVFVRIQRDERTWMDAPFNPRKAA